MTVIIEVTVIQRASVLQYIYSCLSHYRLFPSNAGMVVVAMATMRAGIIGIVMVTMTERGNGHVPLVP